MSEWVQSLAAPAIAVSLLAVLVHGIKAGIDIANQVRNRRLSHVQTRLAYVTSLLHLIDGLPVSEGERVILKLRIAQAELPDGVPQCIRDAISAATAT